LSGVFGKEKSKEDLEENLVHLAEKNPTVI